MGIVKVTNRVFGISDVKYMTVPGGSVVEKTTSCDLAGLEQEKGRIINL